MSDKTYLDWPFFDDAHRALAHELDRWCADRLAGGFDHQDVDSACNDLVALLGEGGWLEYCVPKAHGGRLDRLDSRSLCLARETLAQRDIGQRPRGLLRITLPEQNEQRFAVKDLVDRLMGRDPAQRFMFIQNRAGEVDRELIDA